MKPTASESIIQGAFAWGVVGMCAVCIVAITGCAYPRIERIDLLHVTGLDKPLTDASIAQWSADSTRLAEDIERSVQRLHWGLASLNPRAPSHDRANVGLVRATAILPDGLSARIVGWAADDQTVVVAISVGPFGHPAQEKAFIHQLVEVLAGKPKPRRGIRFRLPEEPSSS